MTASEYRSQASSHVLESTTVFVLAEFNAPGSTTLTPSPSSKRSDFAIACECTCIFSELVEVNVASTDDVTPVSGWEIGSLFTGSNATDCGLQWVGVSNPFRHGPCRVCCTHHGPIRRVK